MRDGEAHGKLLATIVDSIPAMIAYWDTEQRCVFANRAYERWFGVAPAKLVGMHASELLGPMYELNAPHIEAALRGEAQIFERTLPDRQGGAPLQGLVNYIPNIVDGVVQGFYVHVSDVSALKRAELAERESEARFRLTLDEAPIGMALVAADGRFLRVNRALCELVGYSAEELVGLTFQAITHPDDLDTDLALAAQLERGEIPRYHLEKRYIRKDGTIVDVMLSGSALRRADGSLIHYIAQIEDIREQKRIESEQRFLSRVGAELTGSLDHDTTLQRLAEVAAEEIADLCIVESVDDSEEVRRVKVASRDPSKAWLCDVLETIALDRARPHLMHAVLETHRPFVLERATPESIAAFSQSEAHLAALRAADIESMVAVPLLAGGRLLGAIALISSRGSPPPSLRLAEDLAYRAALWIRSVRLYAAAKRATQARDDVLAIVAHDLRNPLNNVMLRSTMIQESGQLPARCTRDLAVIVRSAHRMNRLIQDLLDVARLEAGHLSINAEPVVPNQLLADAVDAQRPAADAAGVELRLEMQPGLPVIHADRDRLQQILDNLVGNALKFTPAGGVIRVCAERDGREVRFHVVDTGCGLKTEHLPHVFDRFWQARRGVKHGAGLGLAIVKGLVEAHGGRIWIDSTAGVGTAVHVALPAANDLTKNDRQTQPCRQAVGDDQDMRVGFAGSGGS